MEKWEERSERAKRRTYLGLELSTNPNSLSLNFLILPPSTPTTTDLKFPQPLRNSNIILIIPSRPLPLRLVEPSFSFRISSMSIFSSHRFEVRSHVAVFFSFVRGAGGFFGNVHSTG